MENSHCTATILAVDGVLRGDNPGKYAHFAYSVWNRVMICVLGELVKLVQFVKLGLDQHDPSGDLLANQLHSYVGI